LRGSRRRAEVVVTNTSPLLPLLHNLLAVKQHTAKQNAGRSAASLLAVVDHERLANLHGQCAVELVFEFVDIVLSATFTQVFKQLFVIVLGPLVDASPGVADGRWRGQAIGKALHLNLALADALEVPRTRLALHSGAEAGRVWSVGRHATIGRHEVVVLGVGAGEVHSGLCGGSDRRQGRVTALCEGSVSSGAVGHVGRGMAVIGRHGVPEGAPYSGNAVGLLATWSTSSTDTARARLLTQTPCWTRSCAGVAAAAAAAAAAARTVVMVVRKANLQTSLVFLGGGW
jgi:hypothetical protein